MNICIDEAIVIKFLDHLQNTFIFYYVLIDVCDISKVKIYSLHFRKEAVRLFRNCNHISSAKLEVGSQISVAQRSFALLFLII